MVQFRVICPKCKNKMLVEPRVKRLCEVSSKSKRCVYCGHSFKIHSTNNSQIFGKDKMKTLQKKNFISVIEYKETEGPKDEN